MNKALQRSGATYRVNEILGLAYCTLAIVLCASTSIVVRARFFDDINDSVVATATYVLLTVGVAVPFVVIFFLKSVKNGAVVLLEPERANQIQSKKDAALALARIIPVIMGAFVICFGGYNFVVTSGELSNSSYSHYISDSSYIPGVHTMPRTSGPMPGMAIMEKSSGNTYTRGGNNELIESDKSSYMYGFANFLKGFSEEHRQVQTKHLGVQSEQLKMQLKQRLLLDVMVICFGTLLIMQANAFGGNRPTIV